MSIEVMSGVPIPKPQRNRNSKYPFAEMKVGDSFHVDGDPEKADALLRSVSYRYGKENAVKFTVRRTESGARIWRVA